MPTLTVRFSRLSAVDVAFGIVVAVSLVAYLRISREFSFAVDDWLIARRVRSPDTLLEPYNKHLSITILAIYRVLYSLFGFTTYLPWRIVGITTFLSVGVALFLLLRTRVGPLVAGLVASYFLWFPGASVEPALLNHYLVLVGAIACAWALMQRTPTSDIVLASALVFSLCAAGGGVSVVAAAAVHALCSGAPSRRWMAIAAPSALWAGWWLVYARTWPGATAVFGELDTPGQVRQALEGILGSFRALAFDNAALGIALVVVFVVHLGWRATQGRVAVANGLAWSAALIVWWGGLAHSRGAGAVPDNFRYAYVGAAFIVLAMLPPLPLGLRPSQSRSRLAAAAFLPAVAAIALINGGAILETADLQRLLGRDARRAVTIANLGPSVLPDEQAVSLSTALTAGQYREVVNRWGYMAGTRPRDVDGALVQTGVTMVDAPEPTSSCPSPIGTLRVPPNARVRVENGGPATTVSVRRFGNAMKEIGALPANAAAELRMQRIASDVPWIVEAPGACLTKIG